MKRILIIGAAVLIAGGFLFWWLSPEQVLKRRTVKLLDAMTLSEGSGAAGRQMNSYALNGLIGKELALQTPTIEQANGTFEKSEIEAGFQWLTSQAKFTRFELKQVDSVMIDGNRATVNAAIEGVVALPSYRPADGAYRVELDWRREEDGWKLIRARWDEAR